MEAHKKALNMKIAQISNQKQKIKT